MISYSESKKIRDFSFLSVILERLKNPLLIVKNKPFGEKVCYIAKRFKLPKSIPIIAKKFKSPKSVLFIAKRFKNAELYQASGHYTYDEAVVYDRELCALIDIWRHDFRNDRLAFVIVQIADYCYSSNQKAWKLIQKAQYEVQGKREKVKTVVSRDVCENDDIHPKTKGILSNRIAEVLIKL